jgi:hypothetical protein
MLVVTIKGGTKERQKSARQMCQLFYEKYFRKDKYLLISIIHQTPLGSLMADCFGLDENPYNEFEITMYLDPLTDEETYLRTLAHELIHVKQFTKGELIEYSTSPKFKFRGSLYDNLRISYWDKPWEIEAFEKEKELYLEYKNFTNQNK